MKPETSTTKRVSALTLEGFANYAVWAYCPGEDDDEPMVRAIKRLAVSSLTGKLVGTKVRLAKGLEVYALLGNIDCKNKRLNEHFVTVSIERQGRWFHLARYHDHDFGDRGPEELARFLGESVENVFPISYDVSEFAIGEVDALAGVVRRGPLERLTRSQVIALAVP